MGSPQGGHVKKLILGSLGFLVAACSANSATMPATDDPQLEASLQDAAASAATTLEDDGTTANLTAHDFTVGEALEENIMGADDIAQNKDKARLLTTGRRAYVVNGPNGYRVAVFVRGATGSWSVSQVHGRYLGMALDNTLTAVRASHKADNDDFFLVEVVGMHLKLLGHRENGALMLTPIHDRSDLSLKAGDVQPAAQLLPRIASSAARWNIEMAKTFGGGK
jgi:hypothetical protein